MTLIEQSPKSIKLGTTNIKKVYLGSTQVRPKPTRTFTISWTEQSNMSSGWTYSDDAAGLTAGSGDFDDFFGYSAVLLNTSGVETAEMKQSGGVFTGAMTTLGNITSGNNVMIKFPVRGIKMTKSGSVVTLSITEELNKTGYQYYAHSTGTLSNPGTPKGAFYLGAYKGYFYGGALHSWSGKSPSVSQSQPTFCSGAKINGSGYNISGFYQRMYVNALYMMKYGNPNSQSVVGMGYSGGSSQVNTGGTDNQTNATYGTSSNTTQVKLFGLEDRWGNLFEWLGGMYTDSNRQLYTMLNNWSGTESGGEATGTILGGNYELSSIAGNNKAMFAPAASASNSSYNTYYCDGCTATARGITTVGGRYGIGNYNGIFTYSGGMPATAASNVITARLMYL